MGVFWGKQTETQHGEQAGGQFPDKMSRCSQLHGDGSAAFQKNVCDEKHGRHADDLFRYLGCRGDFGLFNAVIIAVDTGVDCGEGDGDSDKGKQ